jgi:hypothetical protein
MQHLCILTHYKLHSTVNEIGLLLMMLSLENENADFLTKGKEGVKFQVSNFFFEYYQIISTGYFLKFLSQVIIGNLLLID